MNDPTHGGPGGSTTQDRFGRTWGTLSEASRSSTNTVEIYLSRESLGYFNDGSGRPKFLKCSLLQNAWVPIKTFVLHESRGYPPPPTSSGHLDLETLGPTSCPRLPTRRRPGKCVGTRKEGHSSLGSTPTTRVLGDRDDLLGGETPTRPSYVLTRSRVILCDSVSQDHF